MPGYQFITLETYSRVPSKNKKKQSARGVAKEAERAPEASQHIDNPRAPIYVYGDKPSEIVTQAEKLAQQYKDLKGRKIRKDGQVLLAGIASYPIPTSEFDIHADHFKEWTRLNFKFLKNEYGDQLTGIVLHVDESHPHIHFYVLPKPSNEGYLHIRSVHCGMAARDQVHEKEMGAGKIRSRLYKEAMRAFQDRYFETVGKPLGMAREGPKRRRLSRKQWKEEQAHQERQAQQQRQLDEQQKKVDQKTAHCERRFEEAKDKIQEAKKVRLKVLKAKAQVVQLNESAERKVNEAAELNSGSIWSRMNKTISHYIEQVSALKAKVKHWMERALNAEHEYEKQRKRALELNEQVIHNGNRADRAERENSQLIQRAVLQQKSINQLKQENQCITALARAGRFIEIAEHQQKQEKVNYGI